MNTWNVLNKLWERGLIYGPYIEDLKHALLSGKVTKETVMRVPGIGPKTWKALLEMMEMEEKVIKKD